MGFERVVAPQRERIGRGQERTRTRDNTSYSWRGDTRRRLCKGPTGDAYGTCKSGNLQPHKAMCDGCKKKRKAGGKWLDRRSPEREMFERVVAPQRERIGRGEEQTRTRDNTSYSWRGDTRRRLTASELLEARLQH